MAQDALDLADGKRRVFIAEPYTPYDVGDLWANGADLKRCIKARETGNYVASDWDLATNYTDDSALNDYKKTVDGIVLDIEQSITEAEQAAKDYTDEGKTALQASIDALNKSKANINDVYTKAEADGEISKAEENAIAKAEELANTAQQLAEATAKAYADGEISASEAETLKKYQEALEEAQEAANVANEALGKAEGAQNSADNAQSTANEAKGIAIMLLLNLVVSLRH
jgi:hypothetical protein